MNEHFEQVSKVTVNKVTFTWKIQNFSHLNDFESNLSFEKHRSEIRPSLRYCDLIFYPNRIPYHHLSQKWKNYIGVRLKWDSYEKSTWISKVRIGFKTETNDTKAFYVEKKGDEISESTDRIKYAKENSAFLITADKDVLIKMKSELLPEDVLTVFCHIEYKVFGENLIEVNEESRQGEDIYLKNGSVNLSKSIENLFENSHFSDVTLKVGEDTFQAHKNVLACRSKVFEAMFVGGMKERQENEVSLVEMKSATAKEILQYIYAGKIQELSMDRALDLYVAADRYDLQELRGWCKDFILKHISANDVTQVAIIADLHRDEELTIAAKKTLKHQSKAVMLSEGWKMFAKENFSVYVDLMESTFITGIPRLRK